MLRGQFMELQGEVLLEIVFSTLLTGLSGVGGRKWKEWRGDRTA